MRLRGGRRGAGAGSASLRILYLTWGGWETEAFIHHLHFNFHVGVKRLKQGEQTSLPICVPTLENTSTCPSVYLHEMAEAEGSSKDLALLNIPLQLVVPSKPCHETAARSARELAEQTR